MILSLEPPRWLLSPRKYGTCSSWNYPYRLNYKVLDCKLAPTQEGQGEIEEANDSRLIGSRFNKQGNLLLTDVARLVGHGLEGCRVQFQVRCLG